MRRSLALLLSLLCLLSRAGAESLSGQRYDTFQTYYEEDLAFINENTGRHLLPLVIASRSSEERDGRMYYEILGDVLSMSIRTDPSGEVIEMCQIILCAPQGMQAGDAAYSNFANSGYHSYALLMAMDSRTAPLERYEMVSLVEEGLKQAQGAYVVQVGVYALTCTRDNGTAILTFDHTGAAQAGAQPSAAPGGEETIPPEDEGAGLG